MSIFCIIPYGRKYVTYYLGFSIHFGNLLAQVYLDLNFMEAARGADKTLNLEMMDTCSRCKGKGNEPGSKVARCGYCGGSGMVGCCYLTRLLF